MAKWRVVQWLLRSRQEEFLEDSPLVGMLRQAAPAWARHPALTDEERERIRRVWIDGEYRPGLSFTASRWNELAELGANRPQVMHGGDKFGGGPR